MLGVYWLALTVSTHWPNLKIDIGEQEMSELNVDKIVHWGAFGLLALLLVLARIGGRRAAWARHIVTAACVATIYAAIDEASQLIPIFERTACWPDLSANFMGILAAIVPAWVIVRSLDKPRPVSVVYSRALLGVFLPFAYILLFTPGINLAPLFPQAADPSRFILVWRFDYLGHALGAALVFYLFNAARPFGDSQSWLTRTGAFVVVALASPVIEWVQYRINLGHEYGDMVAHELGLLFAAVVGTGFVLAQQHASRCSAALLDVARRKQTVSHSTARSVDESSNQPESTSGNTSGGSGASEASGASGGSGGASFVGGARTVSVLTFLSRVTGLGRESVLAAVFGRSLVADAFVFGFQIPNLFRRLFGEGALSAALIPVYAHALHKDRLTATRVFSLCLSVLMIFLGLVTLIGEAVLVGLLARGGWSEQSVLAIRLTMVMLPYMPLVCAVAVIGSILQVHHRFASTAAAPILLNLVIITVALLFTRNDGSDAVLHRAVYAVSLSVIVAGVLQLAWQVLAVARVEKIALLLKPDVQTTSAIRSLMRRFAPTAIGMGIFQINTFIDNAVAMALRATDDGAAHFKLLGFTLPLPLNAGDVAALSWAQRLYEFPLGIFGIAIATAIYPALSRAAPLSTAMGGTSADRNHFVDILRHGLRLTVFIGLPASVGLIAVGLPLVRVIFERGQFTASDSQIVSFILIGYAPAIWAYSMNHVLTRAFYALGDTRSPLYLSTAFVLLNFMLNLTFVWFLGPAGFAWATAICAMVQCAAMIAVVRHYVDKPVDRAVLWSWGKCLLASAVMTAALVYYTQSYDVMGMTLTHAGLFLAGGVGFGGAIFTAAALAMRMEEPRWLLRR